MCACVLGEGETLAERDEGRRRQKETESMGGAEALEPKGIESSIFHLRLLTILEKSLLLKP